MNHYLLIYHPAPDYLDRRAQFREVHPVLAWKAAERGDLVPGGTVAGDAAGCQVR